MENNEIFLKRNYFPWSRRSVEKLNNSFRAKFKKWHKLLPYAMISPSLVTFALFVFYPIVYMIYLSFFEWNLIGDKKFIFLNNFIEMYSSDTFWQAMNNSFTYMFLTVFLSVLLALPLALYLNKKGVVSSFLQSVVFSPYVVSLISVAFIWVWLMDSDYGLLNYILNILGFSSVDWLGDPKVALISLAMVSIWKSVGYNTIVILSAMQTIPRFLYEAAELDRAGKGTVFFRITIPMISPTLFFIVLMNMIASFKVFETVSVMTQGGPMNSTNTLVYSIYEYAFQFYKIGYASAIGVVLMIIIGLCTLAYFKILSKKVHYR